MFEAPQSPHLVPFDGSFRVADVPTRGAMTDKKENKERLEDAVDRLDDLQRRLYAADCHSVLLVFQAMDAAGKDSTIRAVFSGINPAGCQVFSFKRPTSYELDHDFLWRTSMRLPERGRIGIFNRSQYEEVLVVKVHPSILDHQKLPQPVDLDSIWAQRYESIRDQELHLARNGTVILKFWLNVSKDEQKNRFVSRLDEPKKNWKFELGDLKERRYWDDYMAAYEQALNETSRPWAPWYAIPADDKPSMRATVAEIVCDALEQLQLEYPAADPELTGQIADIRQQLINSD